MFKELLENKLTVFDGAMGTMLQASGLKMGETPEVLSITNPELLIDIHRQYIESGAQVVYTNTFGANRYKLEHCGYSVEQIVEASIENARQACREAFENSGKKALVALDIGPIGQLLQPTGTLSVEEAYEIFSEIVTAGAKADLIVLETMTDLMEAKAAVLAAKENSDLPVICTMTFEMNQRTFTGCSVQSMALTLSGLGVNALGVNCSLGPKELIPVVKSLSEWTRLPIVVKANAGLPDPVTNQYHMTPVEFAGYMKDLLVYGVRVIGGCCGTTPDYIAELTKIAQEENELAGRSFKSACADKKIPAAICSPTKVVSIDGPRIIGERINPTGKKLFKEALLNNDIDYILNQALEQIQGGADILDVNVGLPGIDEQDMMIQVIQALQSVVEVPLQIDSTIPEVLEAALRVYNGKPIVNSVNGEESSLNRVLPLVKKYGAAVVGLTLDEGGIPKKAEDRFKIAQKILNKALELGIPKEDVYIDCLTLTASAEQEGVMETLKALHMVKHDLGLKTVLGVSNISFGLPDRELVNHTFLSMALTNGLDLPIINPNIKVMSGTVRAFRVLSNIDSNSAEYIKAYSTAPKMPKISPASLQGVREDNSNDNMGRDAMTELAYAIENGLKNEGAQITAQLLNSRDSMEIVNQIIIPTLDKIGGGFERGEIFLPQLIMSAGVAQAAFEVIKSNILKDDTAEMPESKGKIVIATVKGDIHDIGKNIVKVLLENYGYEVVDLGKDVEYQAVVDAVKTYNAKLVGLSALMTTTLVSMKNTIRLIRDNHLDCRIMVGGAVLTPDYAMEIGADFYAKDAKESVDIAKKVLG